MDVSKRSSTRSSSKRSSTRSSDKRSSTRSTKSSSSDSLKRISSRSSKRLSTSKRDSLRKSVKRENAKKPKKDKLASVFTIIEPVSLLTTIWVYSSFLWNFLTVYMLQAIAALYDSMKERKWTKKERLLIMGRLFRKTSSVMVIETNPFWKLHTKYDVPLESLPKEAIYMSNHLSYADPFFLCSAQQPIETKYVGKGDLWDIPVAGKALHNSGDMPVHFVKDKVTGRYRSRTGNTSELMETARWYISNGMPISIFPEGAISKTNGGIMPFKTGFFKLACELNAAVIPVAMWGNHYAWPMDPRVKGEMSVPGPFLAPADVYVHFGKPMYPEGLSPEEFALKVQKKIVKMRNKLPGGNSPEKRDQMFIAQKNYNSKNKN